MLSCETCVSGFLSEGVRGQTLLSLRWKPSHGERRRSWKSTSLLIPAVLSRPSGLPPFPGTVQVASQAAGNAQRCLKEPNGDGNSSQVRLRCLKMGNDFKATAVITALLPLYSLHYNSLFFNGLISSLKKCNICNKSSGGVGVLRVLFKDVALLFYMHGM